MEEAFIYPKIIATLGPSSEKEATIEALIIAGVDVFRLNMSHGSRSWHEQTHKRIRETAKKCKRMIGILLDLQGPKFRIGLLPGNGVTLQAGDLFILDSVDKVGDVARVSFPHPKILALLRPNTLLMLDDGSIQLKVVRCGAMYVECTVEVGGLLSSHKGVNIPNIELPVMALTEKDKSDLQFGLSLGCDWIALSFVQRPADIAEIQALIGGRAKIMAKIEKPLAITSLEGIIQLADGLMVARGDLAVEVPPWTVPRLQRFIVKHGKPVVVATQLLDSMQHHPLPTRAEVSDVASAVYMGADGVMLSAETAMGEHCVAAVSMLRRIAFETCSDKMFPENLALLSNPANMAALAIPQEADVWAVVRGAAGVALCVRTESVDIARAIAASRALSPVLLLTATFAVAHQAAMLWGVRGCLLGSADEDCTAHIREFLHRHRLSSALLVDQRRSPCALSWLSSCKL